MWHIALNELPAEKRVIRVGTYVAPDGWGGRGHCGERLIASDWERAAFRLPTRLTTITSLAVNVEITGRSVEWIDTDRWWVRVRVTFVGDGEPDRVVRGWAIL